MARSIREVAMNYLARREHSRWELEQKLAAKEYDADGIKLALDRLLDDGLLSDLRFAEAYTHARKQRGNGPLKIQSELKLRGVSDDIISRYLDCGAPIWHEVVKEVRCKRFGAGVPAEYEQRMRQARFLQQRGFTHEQISAAFKK
ncbi:Regulatory protein RecX [hydrothermal vent metagenome]|uniref:Regulatory protein RecX n=1 Tax=hydrothermal vent metagenome TaxID=652676 RepID=A0A3B1BA62_9ZZZZ